MLSTLASLPETTIAKQAFLMSKDLYLQNKTSFYTNAMNILKSYKHETPDLESITNISVKSIITNIKETYSNVWKNEIKRNQPLTQTRVLLNI
jgi:hypothetical protein